MKKSLLIVAVLIFVLASCDYIPPEENSEYYYTDTLRMSATDTDSTLILKKVLLIEFTGIRCTNCPEAHEVIKQIKQTYPDNFIAVSMHGTILARPIGEFANEPDLRTDEGNQLISDFGISGIPIGIVDYLDKTHLSYKDAWASEASLHIKEQPAIEIKTNVCYCNNKAKINIRCTALQELSGAYNLAVYVTEDSIITLQASAEGNIENYVQLNVFRKSLSGVYGKVCFSGETQQNTTYEEDFSIEVPESWKANNCKIIAFVYSQADKKIINAEEQKFVE